MIVIPKEKPILDKLNTYYLHIDKLLEYCKREQGSGCIYFVNPTSTAVVFFDPDDMLNTVFASTAGNDIDGAPAYQKLLDSIDKETFQVAVYKIELNHIYNWVGLHQLNEVPFENQPVTSLDGLLKNMESQNLSGYIHAQIGEDAGLLLLQNGMIVCGSYSWGDGTQESDKKNLQLLIGKSKDSGGDFYVRGKVTSPDNFFDTENKIKSKIEKAPSSTIATLEELLDIFDRVVNAEAELDTDLDMLLKDKFIEKANFYSFLDPFAGEFTYNNNRIQFKGNATDEELTAGITECIRELADELGVLHILKKEITNWSTYLGEDIAHICKKFL